uniref:Uncharacterized protein n=1 Tax=Rhizophora mucronata TaxID=61149 RepID=A0A2P2R080_RHIMU
MLFRVLWLNCSSWDSHVFDSNGFLLIPRLLSSYTDTLCVCVCV